MYSKTRTEILIEQKHNADEVKAQILRDVPFEILMKNEYLMNVVFPKE